MGADSTAPPEAEPGGFYWACGIRSVRRAVRMTIRLIIGGPDNPYTPEFDEVSAEYRVPVNVALPPAPTAAPTPTPIPTIGATPIPPPLGTPTPTATPPAPAESPTPEVPTPTRYHCLCNTVTLPLKWQCHTHCTGWVRIALPVATVNYALSCLFRPMLPDGSTQNGWRCGYAPPS